MYQHEVKKMRSQPMKITKATILTLFILCSSTLLLAQGTIKGKVLDYETKEPVALASVYFANTRVGVSTKPDGTYEIDNIKPGIYELVVSHIAYESKVEVLELTRNKLTVNFRLVEKTSDLNDFELTGEKMKRSERLAYERFREFFFGYGYDPSAAHIKNEQIVELTKAGPGEFEIPQEYKLEVENEHLGYELEYLLRSFYISYDTKLSLGYPRFIEKEATDNTIASTWAENRQLAYNGSIRHFFKALIDGKLSESGFAAYSSNGDPEGLDFFRQSNVLLNESNFQSKYIDIKATSYDNIKRIRIKTVLDVDYLNEFNPDGSVQNSQVKPLEEYMYVYTNGVIINPSAIKVFGQWADEGVYEMLPNDFESNDTLQLGQIMVKRDMIGKLREFSEEKPIEKVYVHTDRNDYYPGETLWLKYYLTAGPFHQLSPLSKNIYTSLVDKDGKTVTTQLTTATDGLAHSQIELPDTLASGTYSLHAYSEYMKNYGEAYSFKKNIKINSKIGDNPKNNSKQAQIIDLQFLPEGGNLLANVPNRVAFRAVGSNGQPVSVKGTLTDSRNDYTVSFSSEHNGIGVIDLIPSSNARFSVEVEGVDDEFDFPKIDSETAILTVDPLFSETQVKVTVRTDIRGLRPFLINQFRGLVNYSVNLKIQNGVREILVPKASLHAGINHLTLFSETGEPIAQRLFFLRKEDRTLNVSITMNDSLASKRSQMEATIKVLDQFDNPVEGSFSLSAFNLDRSFIKEASTNIEAHLLLNSDLSGSIYNPAYYFDAPDLNKDRQLDLVMMTHGWTRFEWEQLEDLKEQTEKYAYNTKLKLSGQVFRESKRKKPQEANISLINNSTNPAELHNTVSNRKGEFSLEGLQIMDQRPFVIQASATKGKHLLNVQLEEIKIDALPTNSFVDWPLINQEKEEASITLSDPSLAKSETREASFIVKDNKDYLSTTTLLDDVVITADREEISREISPYGEPTLSFDPKEAVGDNSGDILEYMKGKIPGVEILSNGLEAYIQIRGLELASTSVDALTGAVSDSDPDVNLFLNNMRVTLTVINTIPANLIDRVDVFKGPDAAVFGANSAGGAILFYTKSGYEPPVEGLGENLFGFTKKGYTVQKKFYAPIYDANYEETGIPDFRISLHWEPQITTDENGEAKVTWYNSDDSGDLFQVMIEGISKNGQIGSARANYVIGKAQN